MSVDLHFGQAVISSVLHFILSNKNALIRKFFEFVTILFVQSQKLWYILYIELTQHSSTTHRINQPASLSVRSPSGQCWWPHPCWRWVSWDAWILEMIKKRIWLRVGFHCVRDPQTWSRMRYVFYIYLSQYCFYLILIQIHYPRFLSLVIHEAQLDPNRMYLSIYSLYTHNCHLHPWSLMLLFH